MITRFLFFITFMAFIFSADTTKVSKDKYISIPIDFSLGTYGFTYGVNNNWEINLGFSGDPNPSETRELTDSFTDNFAYYTYTDGQWNETEETVTFNSYNIRNSKAFIDYSLNVGFKKFFRYKEKENNYSNFYVQTKISYTNTGGRYGAHSYTEVDYFDIGYEYIDYPTDEPQEGDTWGEFINQDETNIIVSSSKHTSSRNSTLLDLSLGCQYNAKQQLFGISDLHFGMNIEFLSLKYSILEENNFYSQDYNEDYMPYQDREDSWDKEYNKDVDFRFRGPSIILFLKYFF